jgi:hypothetical protein
MGLTSNKIKWIITTEKNLVTSSKHCVRFRWQLAFASDTPVLISDLCRLLERDTERLSAHRWRTRLQVGVGLAHVLDLILALDVTTERRLASLKTFQIKL